MASGSGEKEVRIKPVEVSAALLDWIRWKMGYDLLPLIEADSTGLEMIQFVLREGNVIVSCNQA